MTRRFIGAVAFCLLLAACRGPAESTQRDYCDAVVGMQQRWGHARTLEGGRGSFDELDSAIARVEEQAALVAEVAPDPHRDEWQAIGGPGNAGGEAMAALEHADASCETDLVGIFDGLTRKEIERYEDDPG